MFLSVLLFGHFSEIAGRTLLIKYNLDISLPTEVIALVSRVHADLLMLFLFAGSWVTNGKIPILPENVSFPSDSNLGRATAAKNMTFVKKFLLLQVCNGSHTSRKR